MLQLKRTTKFAVYMCMSISIQAVCSLTFTQELIYYWITVSWILHVRGNSPGPPKTIVSHTTHRTGNHSIPTINTEGWRPLTNQRWEVSHALETLWNNLPQLGSSQQAVTEEEKSLENGKPLIAPMTLLSELLMNCPADPWARGSLKREINIKWSLHVKYCCQNSAFITKTIMPPKGETLEKTIVACHINDILILHHFKLIQTMLTQ